MALLLADSFDSYSGSSDLTRNWQSSAGWTWGSNVGRAGGGGISTTASAQVMRTAASLSSFPSGTPGGVQMWFKISANPSVQLNNFVDFVNSALSDTGGRWAISTAGKFLLLDRVNTTQATGTAWSWCDGNWHWLEGRTNSNGANYLSIDLVQQWSLTVSLGAITWNNFVLNSSATGNYFVDDFICSDNNAGAPVASSIPYNQVYLINTQRADGDSAIQFTPDSGSNNFSRVNETSPDEDTSYVQDNISGHVDEYTFADLGFAPQSVLCIQLTVRAKNPGAGGISFKSRNRSGATVTDGVSTPLSPSYQNYRTNYPTDPNTGAAWTGPNVDASKWGPLVV